jgi:Ca2+-binding RTX toxin-like protein
MVAMRPRSGASVRWALVGAALALGLAMLAPASAGAFATFSNGTLTVHASEGKVVPRCGADGELTVSGLGMDDGRPVFCRELRRIEADSIVGGLFDFSQLPDDLGGQGPIEIHARSLVDDRIEIANDKFIGAPGHINIFEGGLGFDVMTGGNLNDQLSGGEEGDKIEGGPGNDSILGGGEGDKLDGGPGNDRVFGGAGGDKVIGGVGSDRLFGGGAKDKIEGGPGRDVLKGGGGADKLLGGPGKDVEKQ